MLTESQSLTESPRLVTAREIAARLAVQPATVSYWARRGKIPCVQYTTRTRRFVLAAVFAALGVDPLALGCENGQAAVDSP